MFTQVDVFIDWFESLILDHARSACSSMVSTADMLSRLVVFRTETAFIQQQIPAIQGQRKGYKSERCFFLFWFHVTPLLNIHPQGFVVFAYRRSVKLQV